MNVGRNTVYNWFVKGSAHLKKVLPILKEKQQERQGEKTSRIIQRLRHRLDKLLVDTRGMRGNLMQKALNYLNSFWNQLILISERWPVQYRPLELCSLATSGAQELACGTIITHSNCRAQTLGFAACYHRDARTR